VSGIDRQQRYICGSHTNGGNHACSNGIHVARERAEQHILAETVEQLLSPEAVALAAKEMQRLYRERQGRPAVAPRKHAAQLARLDRQIEELARLEREGVLTGAVAAAASEKARADRAALFAASDKGEAREGERVVRMLPQAAAEYRKTVAAMGSALGDARRIHQARAALREILGETIPLSPAADGRHLVAEMTFNRQILFQAAGSGIMNGSGGALC